VAVGAVHHGACATVAALSDRPSLVAALRVPVPALRAVDEVGAVVAVAAVVTKAAPRGGEPRR